MLKLLYDAFELHKMGEYSDNHGGTFCEIVMAEPPDEECLRIFWVVQGHTPNMGVETLMESDNLTLITLQYGFLCQLLDSHKKLHKLMEMLK